MTPKLSIIRAVAVLTLSLVAMTALARPAQALDARTQQTMIENAVAAREQSQSREVTGYVLALSWSPAFCAARRDRLEQCERRLAWVIHGLWPQGAGVDNPRDHPFACGLARDAAPLPRAVLERGARALPSERLAAHQWFKHGTCVEGVRGPDDYFARIETLSAALARPALQGRMTIAAIRQAFVKANPQLPSAALYVHHRDGQFREARLCYDRAFRFAACRIERRQDESQALDIRAP